MSIEHANGVPRRPKPAGGSRWPAIIIGLIAANMIVCAVTVYFAASDRSFAVEPGYDRKAREWDVTARQRDRSASLHWSAAWTTPKSVGEPLVLNLLDAAGQPLAGASVRIVAFHRARASHVQQLDCTESSPGRYTAPVKLDRAGLWELRITAVRTSETFVDTQTLRIAAGASQGAAE